MKKGIFTCCLALLASAGLSSISFAEEAYRQRDVVPITSITRISVNSLGRQANGDSGGATISANGRLVAFTSRASNLVDGDTNGTQDVFIKNLSTGVVRRVSTTRSGEQANSYSRWAVISPDGTKVLFASSATNLVPDDTNRGVDLFIKNIGNGSIQRVNTTTAGGASSAHCRGRVVFSGWQSGGLFDGCIRFDRRGYKF